MIRKANINDKENILKLGEIVNKKFAKVYDVEQLFKESYNRVYLAEKDNKVVGMLMAIVLYESCEILNVVVLEEYRGKNIATNLIDTLISELDDNVDTITLEVAVDNEEAIGLYKKFGFEIIKKREEYYDGKDAYLMGVKYERC